MIMEATEADRNQTFLERMCKKPLINQDFGLMFLVVLNTFIAITAALCKGSGQNYYTCSGPTRMSEDDCLFL